MRGKKRNPAWGLARLLARVFGLAAILLVLIVASAAILIRVVVTPEQLQSLVASQLQEALRRPVQISEVNVMVLQGIRLRGLRVLEAPGFPGGEFLSSEIAVAKYRWAALLERRLEFTEVRLVSPRIQLVRRQDGVWNVQDLFKPKTSASTGTPRGLALPVSLAADMVGVEDANLSFKDLARGRSVDVKTLDLEVRDFGPGAPFPVTASFVTDTTLGGRQVQLKTSLSGRLSLASFRWPEASLEAEKLKIQAGDDTMSGSGSLKDFSAPAIDLKLKVPRLTSENLGRYAAVPSGISIPPSLMRLRAKLPEPGTIRVDSFEASAEPLKFRASGLFKLGDDPSYRVTAALPQASLERVSALWAGFAPKALSGTADLKLTVSGKPGPGHKPAIEQLNLTLGGFAAALSTSAAVTGADVSVVGTKNLDEVEFRAPKGRLILYGNVFSDVDLVLRLTGGDLDIEKLQFTWSVSKAKLKGRIRNLAAPKGVDLEGTVDKLQLLEAINATTAVVQQLRTPRARPQEDRKWSQVFKYAIPKSFPATSGNLRITELSHPNFNTFNVDVKWGLQGISTGLDRATGWVRTGFGPGRVSNIPELENAHKLLKGIFLPFVFMHQMQKKAFLSIATAYPKTLDFNRIYGQYRVQDGVMEICAFHVDSHQLILFADGKVDFPKEGVGMHVLTRLTKSEASLPQHLVDTLGRPSIAFYVKDDLNKPDFELDLRKMSGTAIEDALQAGLKCGQ